METITLERILHAEKTLKAILPSTPLIKNEWFSKAYECEVFLKLEIEQPVGSFKIRGATYRISQLNEEQKARGIIAASAGNHAQGVAWGARHYGTNALIVMPVTAPLMKVENTESLGAKVHLEGNNYDECYLAAQRLSQETGRVYVHAFKDLDVMAGQATVAMEVLSQCPEVDFVVGSIGGGGMMSGVGTVFKNLKPSVKIIGCQAQQASSMVLSLHSQKLVQPPFKGSFADGISVKNADAEVFELLSRVVDESFCSDESEIAMNVLRLIEKAKIVAEGSGAITLGALDRYASVMKGKKVVLVISGGNIDVNLLSRIIDQGLIRSGRRLKLRVMITDRPGSLSKLTSLVGSLGANILQVVHERAEMDTPLDQTSVELMLETRGPDHSRSVVEALESQGNQVEKQ